MTGKTIWKKGHNSLRSTLSRFKCTQNRKTTRNSRLLSYFWNKHNFVCMYLSYDGTYNMVTHSTVYCLIWPLCLLTLKPITQSTDSIYIKNITYYSNFFYNYLCAFKAYIVCAFKAYIVILSICFLKMNLRHNCSNPYHCLAEATITVSRVP